MQLIKGNSLELLKEIPSDSVDLVVTDPPYKMNHSTGGCTSTGMKDRWKGNIKAGNTVMDFETNVDFQDWIPEVYRVLKDGSHCYIFCNDKNMQELLNAATDIGFKESNILVWIKNNSTPNRYYMKNLEFVVFLYKGKAKPINNMGSKCAVEVRNINGKDKFHPTEKPVELLKSYILNSSQEGDVVLDCFMGSGSTGVACKETGRDFIGFEIKDNFFEIAKKRIEESIVEKPRELKLNSWKK